MLTISSVAGYKRLLKDGAVMVYVNHMRAEMIGAVCVPVKVGSSDWTASVTYMDGKVQNNMHMNFFKASDVTWTGYGWTCTDGRAALMFGTVEEATAYVAEHRAELIVTVAEMIQAEAERQAARNAEAEKVAAEHAAAREAKRAAWDRVCNKDGCENVTPYGRRTCEECEAAIIREQDAKVDRMADAMQAMRAQVKAAISAAGGTLRGVTWHGAIGRSLLGGAVVMEPQEGRLIVGTDGEVWFMPKGARTRGHRMDIMKQDPETYWFSVNGYNIVWNGPAWGAERDAAAAEVAERDAAWVAALEASTAERDAEPTQDALFVADADIVEPEADADVPAPVGRTYRERREARAARLRGWADGRDAKAEAARDQAAALADVIPFGQPILVGHHSEGRARRDADRIERGFRTAHEHAEKADSMRAKADNIEAAARAAIYSDDVDAAERLAARLADLEAQRDRVKAYNVTCRKGSPDVSLLDDQQREDIASALRFAAWQCKDGAFPAYYLNNLGGQISKTRKRLAEAVQAAPEAPEAEADADVSDGDVVPVACDVEASAPAVDASLVSVDEYADGTLLKWTGVAEFTARDRVIRAGRDADRIRQIVRGMRDADDTTYDRVFLDVAAETNAEQLANGLPVVYLEQAFADVRARIAARSVEAAPVAEPVPFTVWADPCRAHVSVGAAVVSVDAAPVVHEAPAAAVAVTEYEAPAVAVAPVGRLSKAEKKAANRALAAAMRAQGFKVTPDTWAAAKAGTLAGFVCPV